MTLFLVQCRCDGLSASIWENPISTRVLDGELTEGDVILVDFVAGGLMISKK
jgi:D-tyrosyl-tRNA(Tyr) deacylase